MEKDIVITKVAINGGMFLKVSYKELLPDSDERSHPNVSCSAPVHIDLATAFANFKPHLALIGEEITNNQFIDSIPEDLRSEDMVMEMGELVPAIKAARSKKGAPKIPNLNGAEEKAEDIMERFSLSVVEFKQNNGIESIVLTGEKRLSTYKWIGLGPTPPVKENDSEYKFISDLLQLGEILKYEVKEYILNHKYAPPADPELPFGDGPVIGNEEINPLSNFTISPSRAADNEDA
jgi:hypothetical protein